MALPTWLTLNPATIQADSKITPEMWLVAATDATLQADITRFVASWSSVAITRLRRACLNARLITVMTDDLSTILDTEAQQIVCLAVQLLVTSSLWQNLDGHDAQIHSEANNTGAFGASRKGTSARITSGEGLLDELEDLIITVGEAVENQKVNLDSVGRSIRPYRTDGYTYRPIGGMVRLGIGSLQMPLIGFGHAINNFEYPEGYDPTRIILDQLPLGDVG